MSKIATAKSQTAPTPKKNYHVGRPTKYKRKYCSEILKYFDKPLYEIIEIKKWDSKKSISYKVNEIIPCELPTLAGFCCEIGVDSDTLGNWAKEYPEFFGAINRAKKFQEKILVTNTLSGKYNGYFAGLCAANYLNWKQKNEVTGKDDQPLTIQTIDYSKIETKE